MGGSNYLEKKLRINTIFYVSGRFLCERMIAIKIFLYVIALNELNISAINLFI